MNRFSPGDLLIVTRDRTLVYGDKTMDHLDTLACGHVLLCIPEDSFMNELDSFTAVMHLGQAAVIHSDRVSRFKIP